MNDTPTTADCPKCEKPLSKVRYSMDSMLNEYQWDGVKAGDWFCDNGCKGDRGKSGLLYFWDRELHSGTPTIADLIVRLRTNEGVRCTCIPAYKDRGMTDPECEFCPSEELRNEAAEALRTLQDKLDYALMTVDREKAICEQATEQLETRITQWKHASDYSIDLQRLIESFCHGRELPSPDLHHSKMLSEYRNGLQAPSLEQST